MKLEWKQTSPTSHVYYDKNDGKIYGKIHSTLANSTFTAFFNNFPIGEFISLEMACKAVEDPKNIETRPGLVDHIASSAGARP